MYTYTPNSWIGFGHVGKNVVNSSGDMSRLRSRLGIRVSGANRPSEFIIVNRIKKVIIAAVASADEKLRITYDRMTSKLDRMSINELEFILFILGEEGFDEMIAQMQLKHTVIHRSAAKWKRANEESQMIDADEAIDPIL